MKLKFKTDEGDKSIEADSILQFWHLSLQTTAIEYKTETGDKHVFGVNHPFEQVTAAIIHASGKKK